MKVIQPLINSLICGPGDHSKTTMLLSRKGMDLAYIVIDSKDLEEFKMNNKIVDGSIEFKEVTHIPSEVNKLGELDLSPDPTPIDIPMNRHERRKASKESRTKRNG